MTDSTDIEDLERRLRNASWVISNEQVAGLLSEAVSALRRLLREERAEAKAQVRVAYGFDRDAVFANLDAQTARAEAAESRLLQAQQQIDALRGALERAKNGLLAVQPIVGGAPQSRTGTGLRSSHRQSGRPAMTELTGWRDISTAPKDGTRILTINTRQQNIVWCAWFEKHRGYFVRAGGEHLYQFTHWMPLPDAPSGGSEAVQLGTPKSVLRDEPRSPTNEGGA